MLSTVSACLHRPKSAGMEGTSDNGVLRWMKHDSSILTHTSRLILSIIWLIIAICSTGKMLIVFIILDCELILTTMAYSQVLEVLACRNAPRQKICHSHSIWSLLGALWRRRWSRMATTKTNWLSSLPRKACIADVSLHSSKTKVPGRFKSTCYNKTTNETSSPKEQLIIVIILCVKWVCSRVIWKDLWWSCTVAWTRCLSLGTW